MLFGESPIVNSKDSQATKESFNQNDSSPLIDYKKNGIQIDPKTQELL